MELNLPNWITISRIALIPVFMTFLLAEVPHGDVLAVATFAIAACTDSLDGYFARRRRQKTALGAFLDPLADKLLVSAALIALVDLDKLSAWAAMVIIAREFAVSGLRMVAAAQHVVMPASRWGKVKTASQMIAILALIVEPSWGGLAGHSIAWYLLNVALVLTVASGVEYFVRAKEQLGGGPKGKESLVAASGAVGEATGETASEPGLPGQGTVSLGAQVFSEEEARAQKL